jgi:hypothetical protein
MAQTHTRLVAAFHYMNEEVAFIDKHIDYDNRRSAPQRAKVNFGGKVHDFPNLLEARSFVIENKLTERQQHKAWKLEIGYPADVTTATGWKKSSAKGATMKAYPKTEKPVERVVITMTVNNKRVKVDCPSTKDAITILKNL